MFGKQLIHLEHVSTVRLKYHAQGIITDNLSLVAWILEVVFPYVCPQLLHNLNQTRRVLKYLYQAYFININTSVMYVIKEPNKEDCHKSGDNNLSPWQRWLTNYCLKFRRDTTNFV
jgi:hypothetical protein